MTEANPNVVELRKALDEAEIHWTPVRDYPNATFLPDSQHTIVWVYRPGEEPHFEWGHRWEYSDRTVEDLIERFQQLPEALGG